MSRYFFNIRQDGEMVLDQEGEEFASFDDARASAVKSVRELSAARIKDGLIIANECMEIADETGAICSSISFQEVVREQLKP